MAEILTTAEFEDIERFQEQRRKQPVPEDAWLYVAEIDRLIASHRALAAERDKLHSATTEQRQTIRHWQNHIASMAQLLCCTGTDEDVKDATKALQERIRTLESACEAALKAAQSLDVEALGRDPVDGYFYRDELISKLEGAS